MKALEVQRGTRWNRPRVTEAWYAQVTEDIVEPERPILDHFGTPLGYGASFRGRGDAIFEGWKQHIAALAQCPNVVARLGGLAQPDNGFGWHEAARPPTSDELVAAHQRYYLHTIECFGVDRCMFESNLPVDRLSVSYPVLRNAFKDGGGLLRR